MIDSPKLRGMLMYQERFIEHEVEMQQAMSYLAERYSECAVDSMTDCEIAYNYSRLLSKEHKANRPCWYY